MEEVKKNDVKPKKKLSKKIIFIIVAAVMAAVFVIIFTCCWFLVPESYHFDLESLITEANLSWSDEFDGDTIDRSKWTVEPDGKNSLNWVEGGKQERIRRGAMWSSDQLIVEETLRPNGDKLNVLKIRTEKKGDMWYTSGITTQDSFSQKYGYFEISARLPQFNGIWSAFWMMPEGGFHDEKDASINGAEIDIMEAPCYPDPYVQQAVHIGGYEKKHESTFWLGCFSYDIGDIYEDFHTYGVFWNEDIYKFYVDGKCVWTTSFNRTGNVSKVAEYLFLSVEVPGENGVVGNSPWALGNNKSVEDNTAAYADYEIDYVRAYRLPESVVNITK